jgi:hypothetical protein
VTKTDNSAVYLAVDRSLARRVVVKIHRTAGSDRDHGNSRDGVIQPLSLDLIGQRRLEIGIRRHLSVE